MAAGLMGERLDTLVHRADLDGLIRLIDDLTDHADFVGLRLLRNRCRDAVDTGRQLWPAATLAEYRIALLGPAEVATSILDERAGRFTIGPLSEVVAQHHTWAELAPLLGAEPMACSVAHERAIRGEPIDPASLRAVPPVLDIPAVLQPWEPAYPLAVYRPEGAEFPPPPIPPTGIPIEPEPGAEVLDDDMEPALRHLVEAWTAESNGRAEAHCVVGGPGAALGALGLRRARIQPITAADAIAWLAWAGASGGAHGRRRGMALGRFGAWWLLAALGDLLEDWPVAPTALGAVAAEIDWYWWDAAEPRTGWNLSIVAHHRDDDVAWVMHATDAA